MVVQVFYKENYYEVVEADLLDGLIKTQKIKYFYRKSGKVIVGVDKVRSMQWKPYEGVERRLAPRPPGYRRFL